MVFTLIVIVNNVLIVKKNMDKIVINVMKIIVQNAKWNITWILTKNNVNNVNYPFYYVMIKMKVLNAQIIKD